MHNQVFVFLLISLFSFILPGCHCKNKTLPKKIIPVTYSKPINFSPKHYSCPLATSPIIIDGDINDLAWQQVEFSDDFVDITGKTSKQPFLSTRIKMLWDDNYLYIAGELEDDHIWGTIKTRDDIIYKDNDFEVFIDPDGDTHNYYELEINALGTVWDLLLFKPYRDADIEAGQPYLNNWDINQLKSAVKIYGSINNPKDLDEKWTVELAIPWSVLCETNTEKRLKPSIGEYWRINFSRVYWYTTINKDKYVKIADKMEENWVWSPQYEVAMHQPETWGFVHFVGKQGIEKKIITPQIEDKKWLLRVLYYRQKEFFKANGFYTNDIENLQGDFSLNIPDNLKIETTSSLFEISLPLKEGCLHIRQDGKTWQTK